MGTLVFQSSAGGSVNLLAPSTSSTTNFTLPLADGSNGQVLKTDGSGTLAFATIGISGGGTGVSSVPSNGQLLIGNGSSYTLSTLTQGSGINITNASGSITIAASSGGGPAASIFMQINFGGF
jgi:hypothetical protein